MSALSRTKKTLLTGLATVALGGVMLATASDSADARPRGWGKGGFHGGGGGFGGGFRHGGFRHGGFHHGGFRHHGGFHRGHYGHRRGFGGGALAAGLIGGLALGAVAASAPYYGYGYDYGYPSYDYGYGYAPVSYYGGGECVIERRVTISPWGERIVRREQVCY